MQQGHYSASIFLQFCNTCWKYLQIKLFADGLPNRENCKSFVRQKFKRIQYPLLCFSLIYIHIIIFHVLCMLHNCTYMCTVVTIN